MLRWVFVAVLALCTSASAQQNIIGGGVFGDVKVTSAAYTGPGDIVSGAEVFWSCQFAYTAAIAAAATQKTCNLRRASDNHTCDVIIATTGSWGNTANCSTGGDNGQSASSFCTATTCSVTELYDQTGNGFDATQPTAGLQPTIVFNGVGSNAVISCASASNQTIEPATAKISGATAQPFTISSVYEFTGSAIGMIFASDSPSSVPHQAQHDGAANTLETYAGTVLNATANDNAYHAAQSTFSGGSSAVYVDGSSTSGNAGTQNWGNTANAQPIICSNNASNYFQGNIGEAGFWTVGFSGTQQSNMNSNQHSRWGF